MAIGWKAMRALACFCDLRELAPQLTHFLETLGHVAHDGNYATHADRLALQQHNCELDGDCRAVLAKGGNREQVTFSVAATAGSIVWRKPSQCRCRNRSGMMRSSERPIASPLTWPNIRSAPGFQKQMMPSRSAAMMASERVRRTA